MKILILTLVFPPDNVSTAQIMGNLAEDLRSHGHDVTILTTTPHYNRDPEAEKNQPQRNYWGSLIKKSDYRGIPVYHTLMPQKGKNVFLRLMAWVGFHCLATFVGIAIVPKTDILLVPSPPLTIGLSAWVIGRIRRAPYIYNVQEIYPDIAIRLGAVHNQRIIKLLFKLERFVYAKAAKVTVIAPRMQQNLLNKGIPRNKLEVIPNFVDIDDFPQFSKDNEFSRMYGVHDKFTISYAGNMGVPQGLHIFLLAADLLRHESGIRFIMMGDGMKRESLLRQVGEARLANFFFLPQQPFSLVPKIYASSDANLVPQAAETGFDAVPSKVYRIMACSRPIIAVTDPSSDLARLINEAGCGSIVPPDSAPKLAEAIIWAYRNQEKWRRMGEAGRAHVVKYYTRKTITNQYDGLLRKTYSNR